jgi:hypothetical protein
MVDIVILWNVSMSPIDIIKVQHTWHPIVHGPSVGQVDIDDDKDENMALHGSTGTKETCVEHWCIITSKTMETDNEGDDDDDVF